MGATALVALTFLLPLADTPELSRSARIAAYALVLIPVAPLLHGFVLAARGYATSRLLALGAAAAAFGFLFALLAHPENLESDPGLLLSSALSLANLLRILAAASVGISLARYVSSTGVILLIAAVATASDLFSVLAGPTKMLVEKDSPVLDFLLLDFPTFGSVLGFGLGVSDFVFLALFAAASRFLNLRYPATFLCLCFATFLAVTAGLSLERPLPALPFVAVAFVLVNADLILASLTRRGP
ncbi:MAG: hypothetical protein LC714_04335 [Actinobacteria bacterium]|nr:hypothetical protein [Actinomycetota bacterium]